MNSVYQRKVVINGQLNEISSVQLKAEQDIAFLQSRIGLMKKQSHPNHIVIATYENMLKSRKAVLAWIEDGNIA